MSRDVALLFLLIVFSLEKGADRMMAAAVGRGMLATTHTASNAVASSGWFALRKHTGYLCACSTRTVLCSSIGNVGGGSNQIKASYSSAGNSSNSSSSPGKTFKPQDMHVPLDKLEFSFARSSGPGGQNVNKVNTKAEIRFNVASSDWIPDDVKKRLLEYQSNKISKEGDLIITSQEHRTQAKNKDDCVQKLREMLADAYVEPKDRKMWEGIGEKGKMIRKQEKKFQKEVKKSRSAGKRVNFRDDYDD